MKIRQHSEYCDVIWVHGEPRWGNGLEDGEFAMLCADCACRAYEYWNQNPYKPELIVIRGGKN